MVVEAGTERAGIVVAGRCWLRGRLLVERRSLSSSFGSVTESKLGFRLGSIRRAYKEEGV